MGFRRRAAGVPENTDGYQADGRRAATRWTLVRVASGGLRRLRTPGAIAGVVKDATGACCPASRWKPRVVPSSNGSAPCVTDETGSARSPICVLAATRSGLRCPALVRLREASSCRAGFTATVNAELRSAPWKKPSPCPARRPRSTCRTRGGRRWSTGRRWTRFPPAESRRESGGGSRGDRRRIVRSVGPGSGGSNGDRTVFLIVHGSRGQASPLIYDGMRYNNMNGTPGGGHVIWASNNAAVQEYTVEVGSLSIQAESAGVWQNTIPKQGGNEFHGMVFANFTNASLQSTSNVSDPKLATTRRATRISIRRSAGRSRRTSCGFSAPTAIGASMNIQPAPTTTRSAGLPVHPGISAGRR